MWKKTGNMKQNKNEKLIDVKSDKSLNGLKKRITRGRSKKRKWMNKNGNITSPLPDLINGKVMAIDPLS